MSAVIEALFRFGAQEGVTWSEPDAERVAA
jgi:hypothetical protein